MATEPNTLREVLLTQAAAGPDRLAYDDASRQITFGELAERAERQAAQLAARGVRQGDRVALVMSAGIPFTEAFWAIQLLGATSCAFNPAVPAQTIERRTERIRPRLVLTDGWDDDVAPAARAAPEPELGEDDIAVMQPTSGTSGEPRTVMLPQRNILGYMRHTRPVDDASDHDVLVTWVPPWHDLGLIRFVIATIYYGSPCYIVQPAVSTIPEWLETISRVRGTITGAPDFSFRLACRMVDPSSVDLSSLRYVVNGGEPVRASTIEQFERRFGLDGVVLPGYGLAETTLGVTTVAPGTKVTTDSRGNVSNGTALPGVELQVSDDASAPGEILVRGDYIFAGYFDAIEETRERLRDGWLHTGDTGYRDSEGRLYVLGRSRAMLKRGGAVVAPRELEEAAQGVDGVRMAAAVSTQAEYSVSEVITVVVEAKESEGRAADALAAEVSQAIAGTAGFAPGEVAVVPPRTVPLTANGKVRYDRLRALVADGVIGQAAEGPQAYAG